MSVTKLSLISQIGLKSPSSLDEKDIQKNPAGVNGTQNSKDSAKLKQACRDFEAVFLNTLLSKMRETVPQSDLMGSDQGEKMYRSMLDEELSKQMAASGGTGIADLLYRDLKGQVGK
jgi:flagellar protein FlgJ